MAIGANKSTEQVVGEFKLYTGLSNVNVFAINPTMEELHKLGLDYIQNEPVYISDATPKEGEEANFKPYKKCRLDIYVKNDLVSTKISFFLEDRFFTNKNGDKFQFINKSAQTAWNTSLQAAGQMESKNGKQWFSTEGGKQAKIGEASLHEFILNWMNVKPGDECQLSKFDNLFKGDYKELRELLVYKNDVRVLLTVKDNKYQTIYTGMFDRASNTLTTRWIDHIKKQKDAGYPIKEAYSLDFKQYIAVNPDEDVDTTTEAPSPTADDVF